MIRTLIRILWLGLVRDRIALGLTFVLPIIFFTIFASIFSNMGGGGGGGGLAGGDPLRVFAVDNDQTEISERFLEALEDRSEIGFVTPTTDDGQSGTLSTEHLAAAVLDGQADAIVIVPAGFGASFGDFGGEMLGVEVLYDPTNPMAEFAITGLVQGVAMSAAPDVLIERGMNELEALGGEDASLTPGQRLGITALRNMIRGDLADASDGDGGDGSVAMMMPVQSRSVREVVVQDQEDENEEPSMAPYYAAGIGVMFLLFSMSGAAGSMLKEAETGALERVLSSNITMTGLLASKWFFFAAVGFVQLFIMFIWGSLFFGIELWDPVTLTAFSIVTAVTALAASGFGMMLATLCRSRGQLDGISAIVILMMSAIGGSMVPRFLMPDFMQMLGRFTFNGQALDAFLSIFWRASPDASLFFILQAIALPTLILLAMAVGLFVLSRLFARRWDLA